MIDSSKLPPELPTEVDNAQVEQYVYQLAKLTTDKIGLLAETPVPPEAVDFIGQERVIMNKRISTILSMSQRMTSAFNNPVDVSKINESIKNLVAASSDPAQSMALISRIWKYLEYNNRTPYDPKEYRLYPSTFQMNLEKYAREHNQPPFTESEKQHLFSAIKDWKLGKSPEEILKMLGYSIDAASHRASFPTRASREYARNRGINRDALGRHAQRLREIKTFLEKLFQQKKDPPASPS